MNYNQTGVFFPTSIRGANMFFEQYCEYYKPLLRQFCKELTDKLPVERYNGIPIPHPHIPFCGNRYEQSLVKIAFIGWETAGWAPWLYEYIRNVHNEQWSSSFETPFQDLNSLNFGALGCTTRHSFWGGVLYFLATLYGLKNWEVLKNWETLKRLQYPNIPQYVNILNSFAWGETCAIENLTARKYPYCAEIKEIDRIAMEAAKPLNDYQHIQKLFAPQVTIIMTKYYDDYLRNTETVKIWEKNCDKSTIRLWKAGNNLIVNIPHPHYNKMTNVSPMIRQALIEEGYFQPFLPLMDCNEESLSILNLKVFKRCNPKTTDVRDAIAFIATELCKQNAQMTVRLLCYILNRLGYSGIEYQTGITSSNIVALAYRRYDEGFHQTDIADTIAKAFIPPNEDLALH